MGGRLKFVRPIFEFFPMLTGDGLNHDPMFCWNMKEISRECPDFVWPHWSPFRVVRGPLVRLKYGSRLAMTLSLFVFVHLLWHFKEQKNKYGFLFQEPMFSSSRLPQLQHS
jgi:hypothetical protein